MSPFNFFTVASLPQKSTQLIKSCVPLSHQGSIAVSFTETNPLDAQIPALLSFVHISHKGLVLLQIKP